MGQEQADRNMTIVPACVHSPGAARCEPFCRWAMIASRALRDRKRIEVEAKRNGRARPVAVKLGAEPGGAATESFYRPFIDTIGARLFHCGIEFFRRR